MTGAEAAAGIGGAVAGAGASAAFAMRLIQEQPERLMRVNYRDRSVAAVLGFAVTVGGLVGLSVAVFTGAEDVVVGDVAWAVLAILVLLGTGGAADDLRGDERAKGFSGHIKAALRGRITGGFLKILAGGAAGLAAGALVSSGRAAIEIALLVALTANLFNLFDRAPGRASKIALASALPLVLFGPGSWVLTSAGLWGAAATSLPLDLRERAMLGDTGANPMGGVIGLGLGLALDEPARLVALGVIVALNAASEKWSFSRVIEGNAVLRALDRAGRDPS